MRQTSDWIGVSTKRTKANNRVTSLLKLLPLICILSGCSTTSERIAFDNALSQKQYQLAENIALDEGTKNNQATELLWSLEAGSMLRYNGKQSQSTTIFDSSEELIKGEELKSGVSSGLSLTASLLINDNVTSYQPRVYDRVMVNTYKALNFWALGDFTNARVEWNRTDERQRRAAEYFSKEILQQKERLSFSSKEVNNSLSKSMDVLDASGVDVEKWIPYSDYINPGSLYLHGLYFLLNGEGSGDFDRARVSLSRAYAMTRNSQIAADLRLVKNGRNQPPAVWVIFENGTAARKREMRIDLPLFIVSNNISYAGIALPVLNSGTPAYSHLIVNGQKKTQSFATMDRVIKGEFKTEFTTILIKELTRAISKTVAQSSLLNSDDKTVRLIGQIFAVAQVATTQADLRSWHALPYEFQVARVNWPKNGQFTLSTSDGNLIRVDLPSTPQPIIVYVRAITAGENPQVEILMSKNAL
jgi:hypothetical protein